MLTPAIAVTALALALLLAPSSASAGGDGGARAPARAKGGGGGYSVGVAPKASRRHTAIRRQAKRRSSAPVLEYLRLERAQLYPHGRADRVSFRLTGRRPVHLRLELLLAGAPAVVSSLDLGLRAPRRAHVVRLTGRENGLLAEGRYELRIEGPRLKRRAAGRAAQLRVLHYRFPLAGPFSYGGEGSRFGAARKGHSHRGQDLPAPEGTPVLAPHGGAVETVGYQAGGAGHYVVLDGDDEDRDYVFMHLLTGSIPVNEGAQVRTGQLIGRVGSTGASTGPHLHFELWVGGWYAGGHPVDPLPDLRRWEGSS